MKIELTPEQSKQIIEDMLLPPSCFVGIKKGQTQEELIKEIKQAYELAGEKYE